MTKIMQYDVLFSSGSDLLELEDTLSAGETIITFNSSIIKEDSTIDVYPGLPNVYPTKLASIAGMLRIEFESQLEDMKVKVRIS